MVLDDAGFTARELYDAAGSAVVGRMEIEIVRG